MYFSIPILSLLEPPHSPLDSLHSRVWSPYPDVDPMKNDTHAHDAVEYHAHVFLQVVVLDYETHCLRGAAAACVVMRCCC